MLVNRGQLFCTMWRFLAERWHGEKNNSQDPTHFSLCTASAITFFTQNCRLRHRKGSGPTAARCSTITLPTLCSRMRAVEIVRACITYAGTRHHHTFLISRMWVPARGTELFICPSAGPLGCAKGIFRFDQLGLMSLEGGRWREMRWGRK